jgi:hypothetical protein
MFGPGWMMNTGEAHDLPDGVAVYFSVNQPENPNRWFHHFSVLPGDIVVRAPW